MKGVILAAGDGGRLRPLTLRTPKVLLEVAGHPLIHYPIKAFHSAGIMEIAVIVGHNAGMVVESIEANDDIYPKPTFIVNPYYQGGNALSVGMAHSFTGDESFVLCMGDHIISPEIVAHLLDTDGDGCVLGIDSMARYSFQLDDGTRVKLGPSGEVISIGKDLPEWDALDIGVFTLTRSVYQTIGHLRDLHGLGVELSQVVRWLNYRHDPFGTCDMSGMFWGDVDTLEDYEHINDLIESDAGPGL